MAACEQRDQLQAQLRDAFARWYEVKDVPGKTRDAKTAEKKVHHIQRDLGEHCAKHGCTKDG
jgi:hypothetical protein